MMGWGRWSIESCLGPRLGLKEEALELVELVFARCPEKRDWIEHHPDYDCPRRSEIPEVLSRLK
jgi:hypothetical protein